MPSRHPNAAVRCRSPDPSARWWSRSPPSCAGSTSPCRAGSSTSSPRARRALALHAERVGRRDPRGGLDLVLAAHAKRKGLVEKPRKVPPPSKSDAVPAHVRRAVWLRAEGRCECRLASGEVCGSTYKLELDHYPIPKARGGPPTIENTRLACRTHNVGGARHLFGNAVMDRYTREASAPP